MEALSNQINKMQIQIKEGYESTLLTISESQLKNSDQKILEALLQINAPLGQWTEVAIQMRVLQNFRGFERIMKAAKSQLEQVDASVLSSQNKKEILQIYNTLAGYYFGLSRFRPEGDEKNDYIQAGTECIYKADGIEMFDTAIWITKAFCLLWSHHFSRAIEYFENTLQSQPNNLLAMLGLAIVHATKGKYHQALELLKKILIMNPDVPGIRAALGVCYYRLDQMDIASLCFERSIVMNPKTEVAGRVGKVLILLHTTRTVEQVDKIHEALLTLKEAFQIDSNNLGVVYLLAKLALLRGDFVELQTLSKHGLSLLAYLNSSLLIQLQRSQETVTQNSEGYYLTLPQYDALFKLKAQFLFFLAMLSHNQGKQQSASQLYKECLMLSPSHPGALLNYARIRMATGDFKSAYVCLRSLDEGGKQSPSFIRAYALCLLRLNQLPAAYSFYRRIQNLDVDAMLEFADLCHALQKEKEALQLYTRALSLIESPLLLAQVHTNIGEMWHTLGNTSKARASFENTLRLKPEGPSGAALCRTAQHNLACVYQIEGEFSQAYKNFKEVVNRGGSAPYPRALAGLSRLSLKRGAAGKAIESAVQSLKAAKLMQNLVGEVIDEEPQTEEFARFVGWVYYQLGDMENAQKWFKEAVDLNAEPEMEDQQDETQLPLRKMLHRVIFTDTTDFAIPSATREEKKVHPLHWAQTALGAAKYQLSCTSRLAPATQQQLLKRALDYNVHALEKNRNNQVAANNLACVLAEWGKLPLASNILKSLLLPGGEISIVASVNLAHINLLLLPRPLSISTNLPQLQKTLASFKNKSQSSLLNLRELQNLILKVQVYSVSERSSSDSQFLSERGRLADAVKQAKCASVRRPGQADVMFNLGSALQAMAQLVLKQTVREIAETEQALRMVKQSGKIFESIQFKMEQAKEIKILGAYGREKLEENELKVIWYLSKKRRKISEALLRGSEGFLREAREQESKVLEQRREAERRFKELQEMNQEMAQAKRAQELEEQRKKQEIAEKHAQELSELSAFWMRENQLKRKEKEQKEKKKRGAKKKEDGFIDDRDSDELEQQVYETSDSDLFGEENKQNREASKDEEEEEENEFNPQIQRIRIKERARLKAQMRKEKRKHRKTKVIKREKKKEEKEGLLPLVEVEDQDIEKILEDLQDQPKNSTVIEDD